MTLKNILPNPFRHIEKYQMSDAKVAALVDSIEDTGFWDNLMARPHPTKAGKYEIAYGHHRLEACRKAGIKEVDIPVRDLTDAVMLKMMAAENQDEWQPNPGVINETVKAVIEAAAAGKIELPEMGAKIPDSSKLAFADFGCGDDVSPHFTALQIGEFLGTGWWQKKTNGGKEASFKLRTALDQLKLSEAGVVAEITTQEGELAQRHVAEINRVAKKTIREAETLAIAKGLDVEAATKETKQRVKAASAHVIDQANKGNLKSFRDVPAEMEKAIFPRGKDKPLPDLDQFVNSTFRNIEAILDPESDARRVAKIEELVKYRKDMTASQRHTMKTTLNRLAERASAMAKKF